MGVALALDPLANVGGRPGPGAPLAGLPEPGIVGPRQINVDVLDAAGEKLSPLGVGDAGDAGGVVGGSGEGRRSPEKVQVKASVVVQTRKHPLPAVQHLVQLLRGASVLDGRRESGDAHELAAASET